MELNVIKSADWQHDDDIQWYWNLWMEMVAEVYMHTGNKTFLQEMQPFVVQRASQAMDNLQESLNGTLDLVFVGDDDRIGFGFEQSSIPEAQSVYRFSAVAAMRAAGAAYQKGGDSATAAALTANATKLWDITQQRLPSDWYATLGVHAAASALHSGVTISSQQRQALVDTLTNPAMLPSHSPFSTYFILRGLSAAELGT